VSEATHYRLFASVAPGLETLLMSELGRLLPGKGLRPARSGVEVLVAREELWRVATWSRLAEALRVRVGRFEARRFDELEEGLRRVPWHAWLARGSRPEVRVTTRRSALYHVGAVEERVRRVLRERLGEPVGAASSAGGGGVEVLGAALYVRVHRDMVTVSVDASGELLHRRGYRTHIGKAPLRETLAAACVAQAALPAAVPLLDPFCGSGTIALEALLMDAGRPAQGRRELAFERWPTHPRERYAAWRAQQVSGGAGERRALAADLDPAEVAAARANAARAGVVERLELGVGDAADVVRGAPERCAVVTNLPYGHRTSAGGALREALGRFGGALRERREIAPVLVLSGGVDLDAATGLTWRCERRLTNRGLSVGMYRLDRGGE
jgi:putative N6-adenine-specific DNA methylase